MLYRGTSKVFDTHNVKPRDIPTLSKRLFMIGDKSQYYTQNSNEESLDSTNERVFEGIYKRIKDKLCPNRFNSERTKMQIDKFKDQNPDFCAYFQNPDNKCRFLYIIKQQEESKKKQIRDYYFSLFHTIGKSMVGNSSRLISTSSDYRIAKKFQNNGIIIITWIPRNKNSPLSFDINEPEIHKTIKELRLPAVSSSPYPEQKEYCIQCGILPHFILGFIYDSKFIVNEHLIKHLKRATEINIPGIIKSGVRINQLSFRDVLSQTSFKKFFSFLDGDYFDSTI